MGLGSALARGISGVASGVSRASQSWPQERLQQATLDQRKAEFDAGEAYRTRSLDSSIAQAEAIAGHNERKILLQQLEEAREAFNMGIEVGLTPDQMRPQWDQYQELRKGLTASTIDATDTPKKRTAVEDAFTSKVDTPEAPEVPASEVPDIETGPSPEISVADPSVTNPAVDMVTAMSDRLSKQRHTDSRDVLEETAKKYGHEIAMRHYREAMGPYLTPEFEISAEKDFKVFAEGTTKERRTHREALIEAAVKAASSDDELSGEVWRMLEFEIDKVGGWDSPEEAKLVFDRLRATDLSMDMSGENQTRLGRILAIKQTLASTLANMSDPDIANLFGGLEGVETEIEKRLFNWFVPGPGESPKKWPVPMELISVLNEMKISTDLLSRLQSGAALTEDEVVFYQSLIGSITTNPVVIRQNMKDLMTTMQRMEQGIFEASYIQRYGSMEALKAVEDKYGYGRPGDGEDRVSTRASISSAAGGHR